MKLTVTVEGRDREELASTLEHEVLRLVEEGYKSGADSNDTGSYVFNIEGWDPPGLDTRVYGEIPREDGEAGTLKD